MAAGTVVTTTVGAEANNKYAAIVVDAKTGKTLFASSADAKRYPASLTKMMTLYLTFDALERGKVSLSTRMRISALAAQQAPSKLGLKAGQTITVKDAILGLVTKSANDAAVVVAEHLGGSVAGFAREMNQTARAIGMRNTTFHNPHGLPDNRQVTTARDMALLGRALYDRFPNEFRYFSTRSFTWEGRRYGNHNRLLGQVEGVNGIKTGYTRASGFNLVTSVERNNRLVVAVVMGGRSGASRDAHMADLIKTHFNKASTGKRTAPLLVAGRSASSPTIASATSIPAPRLRPDFDASPATGTTVAALSSETIEQLIMGEGDADEGSAGDVASGADATMPDGWKIQIGAVPSQNAAHDLLQRARQTAQRQLASATPYTEATAKGDTTLYRARFTGFHDKDAANQACAILKKSDFGCFAIR